MKISNQNVKESVDIITLKIIFTYDVAGTILPFIGTCNGSQLCLAFRAHHIFSVFLTPTGPSAVFLIFLFLLKTAVKHPSKALH